MILEVRDSEQPGRDQPHDGTITVVLPRTTLDRVLLPMVGLAAALITAATGRSAI